MAPSPNRRSIAVTSRDDANPIRAPAASPYRNSSDEKNKYSRRSTPRIAAQGK
jgi:hypothetical protein